MDHNIQAMEEYACINHIPIMEKEGIEFLLHYIKDHKIKNILEIGSAIGYSAIRMCLVSSDVHVTTIERDQVRYQEAIHNIQKCGLENRIIVILKDAFDVDLSETFDMIFIDAAKSQYTKFFEKFEKNLNQNGVIVSDNLNFHGLIHMDESVLSRNVRGMVSKLKQYIIFLKKHSKFETTFYDIGDGIGVSVRKF